VRTGWLISLKMQTQAALKECLSDEATYSSDTGSPSAIQGS
jgi:hypothetical protein